MQNFPNPFNSFTNLRFQVATQGEVRLELFDLAGQRVRVLARGLMSPGTHAIAWDGTDERGREVSSGIYVARLRCGETRDASRLLLLK